MSSERNRIARVKALVKLNIFKGLIDPLKSFILGNRTRI